MNGLVIPGFGLGFAIGNVQILNSNDVEAEYRIELVVVLL